MAVGHEPGRDVVRENPFAPQAGDVSVEPVNVRQPAAEHDDVGIEHVDDAGQCPGEAFFVGFHRGPGRVIAGHGAGRDVGGRGLLSGGLAEFPHQRRTREECLHAPPLAAIARRPGPFPVGGPGEGVVAPFPGDGVGPFHGKAADDEAAADAGAEDHPEHHVGSGGGAVGGLGDGETVGVVGKTNRAPERHSQIRLERSTDEPGGIGVLDQAGGGRDGAGDGDADACRGAGACLEAGDQFGDGGDGGLVTAGRRGDAQARLLGPVRRQRHAFDLGAAEVDADTHVMCQRWSVGRLPSERPRIPLGRPDHGTAG